MNKSTVVGAIVVIIVLLSLGYLVSGQLKNNNNFQNNISLTPTIIEKNANIIVDSPKIGDSLSMPFTVKGKAKVFENQLNYRVLDSKGNPLVEGSIVAKAPDAGQLGPFEFTISGITAKGKATLEVFDYSAKDGSEIDKVTLPVILK